KLLLKRLLSRCSRRRDCPSAGSSLTTVQPMERRKLSWSMLKAALGSSWFVAHSAWIVALLTKRMLLTWDWTAYDLSNLMLSATWTPTFRLVQIISNFCWASLLNIRNSG